MALIAGSSTSAAVQPIVPGCGAGPGPAPHRAPPGHVRQARAHRRAEAGGRGGSHRENATGEHEGKRSSEVTPVRTER